MELLLHFTNQIQLVKLYFFTVLNIEWWYKRFINCHKHDTKKKRWI